MVVLAIAILSKGGKPLVSRQFRPLPKSRIDGLLASFPKLIPVGSQHTTVENADVRFVYQPFDEVYVLVMTNKGSNILQDMSTLSLTVRLITSLLPTMSEPAVLANSFELLCAFDEVVSLGYKENASLQQIRNVLEGESHEEKIQEIIARNKEAEAKEELKRRAKQLEMQRREQQRFSQSSGARVNSSASNGGTSNFSPGSGAGVYASLATRADQVSIERGVSRSQSPAISIKPVFQGNGMKLGKKAKQTDFLNEMGREAQTDSAAAAGPVQYLPEKPKVEKDDSLTRLTDPLPDVHITIRETFSLRLSRDGELDTFDAKGDMDLRINNPLYGKVRLQIGSLEQKYTLPDCSVQLQQHPNVAKFTATSANKVIQLRDPNRSFPIGQGLGVLRWRLSTKNESVVPLNITCWTTEISNGTFMVNLEFALNAPELELSDIVINVPLQHKSIHDVSLSEGDWSIAEDALQWHITSISNAHSGGNIEFTCQADHANAFFPVGVKFNSLNSVCGIKVETVLAASSDQQVPATIDVLSSPSIYSIV